MIYSSMIYIRTDDKRLFQIWGFRRNLRAISFEKNRAIPNSLRTLGKGPNFQNIWETLRAIAKDCEKDVFFVNHQSFS